MTTGTTKPSELPSPNLPKVHSRSPSSQSNSYSVLDYYDVESALDGASDDDSDNVLGPTSANVSVPTITSDAKVANNSLSIEAPLRDSRISSGSQNSKIDSTRPVIGVVDEARIRHILGSETDMYGFKKTSTMFGSTPSSYNQWFSKYSPTFGAQKKKWILQMSSHGLAGQLSRKSSSPDRFPPKSEKIKKLIRRGIPPEWRGSAWFFYAGGNERLNKNTGVYEKIAAETEGVKNKDTEVIERDLHRTFPDNVHFKSKKSDASDSENNSTFSESEPAMISSLRRVLTVFAHYQPQIGYCQSLNFIAGLLLLFMSEEHAFWMLVIMTERIIPKVHSANLEGVHTDQGVLMMCIKEYIPKLWAIIGRSYDGTILKDDKILTRLPPLTLVTSSWFMSVFIGILPIESVLRIWDIIWYEGSKTIFRVSLTLCRLCLDDPTFQANRESGNDRRNEENFEVEQIDLFQFIQNFPKQITDPNLLVDLCFKKIGGYGYGFLSQDEINKCREFVAYQRNKLQTKKGVLGAEMSESERNALAQSGKLDDDIHDVYGFNRSIMSGVAWNKHMSGIMKKRFSKRGK